MSKPIVGKAAQKAEHTPVPWRVVKAVRDGPPYIAAQQAGAYVADMLGEDGKLDVDRMTANADFIVRAVNAHDEMLAALKEAARCLYDLLDALGALSNPSELSGMGLSEAQETRILAALPDAEAAIAKVEMS